MVTWQIKSTRYSLWKGLWPWNLASWWLIVMWTHRWSPILLSPPGHMRLRGKLKTRYFFLQKTYVYDHQPLQGADAWRYKAHSQGLGQITYTWGINAFLLQKVNHQVKNIELSDSDILLTLGKFYYWSISAEAPFLQIWLIMYRWKEKHELINIHKEIPCLKSTEKKL